VDNVPTLSSIEPWVVLHGFILKTFCQEGKLSGNDREVDVEFAPFPSRAYIDILPLTQRIEHTTWIWHEPQFPPRLRIN
jgi:hypothetical protein